MPIFRRFFGNKDNNKENKGPEFPFECKGGVCPIKPKERSSVATAAEGHGDVVTEPKSKSAVEGDDKKLN